MESTQPCGAGRARPNVPAMTDEPRAYLSSFVDKTGTRRWRYRRSGRSVYLAGQPGEAEFEAAYEALLTGVARASAEVRPMPGATVPKSFRAAWRLVKAAPGWRELTPSSRTQQDSVAERFLASPVSADGGAVWGDQLVADLKRRHVKAIIAERGATPHAARHVLTRIRQMVVVALDEEWIEHDPTHRVSWNPKTIGRRAWEIGELAAFERRWPVGSTPRLAYALALWQGHRRSDLAALRPGDIADEIVRLRQIKTGKDMVLPIVAMLREVFDATDMSGQTVLQTAYGRPFSAKSLTGRMADWTAAAGLPKGCTLHGLRKTLGKLAAEGGASTRALMGALGHDDIAHAELYSRDAEQLALASMALTAAEAAYKARKR